MGSSGVWGYFVKVIKVSASGNLQAKCNICGDFVSRGSSQEKKATTSNLMNHLKSLHAEEHTKVMASRVDKAKPTAGNSSASADGSSQADFHSPRGTQLTLVQAMERKKSLANDSPRAKEITRLITESISVDYLPFSFVEYRGFRRIMNYLEPRYRMPTRFFIRETSHPRLVEKVKNKVKEILATAKHISFTSDIWTSTASTESYLSLTGHIIDEKFHQQQLILGVKNCPGTEELHGMSSHTAANIGLHLNSILDTWEIPQNAIHAFVTDNGANIVRAVKDCQYEHVPCFAHTLQLVVNDGLLVLRTVSDMVAVARKVVGHFKHSQVATTRFKQIQVELDLPSHRLIQDVITRWNSTFYMLERCVEQKEAILQNTIENKLKSSFTTNQWLLAEKVVTLLRPFEELTREVSRRDVTCSIVVAAVFALNNFLSTGDEASSSINSTKSELQKSLLLRFGDLEANKIFVIATVLDPRYKMKVFRMQQTAKKAEQWLKDMIAVEVEIASQQGPEAASTEPKRAKRGEGLWGCLDDDAPQTNAECANEKDSTCELANNLFEKRLPRDSNIFQWWRDNKGRFPALHTIAMKFLSCPPSSVASECLFSVTGKILSKERTRLKSTAVEELAFVKGNVEIWNFAY